MDDQAQIALRVVLASAQIDGILLNAALKALRNIKVSTLCWIVMQHLAFACCNLMLHHNIALACCNLMLHHNIAGSMLHHHVYHK